MAQPGNHDVSFTNGESKGVSQEAKPELDTAGLPDSFSQISLRQTPGVVNPGHSETSCYPVEQNLLLPDMSIQERSPIEIQSPAANREMLDDDDAAEIECLVTVSPMTLECHQAGEHTHSSAKETISAHPDAAIDQQRQHFGGRSEVRSGSPVFGTDSQQEKARMAVTSSNSQYVGSGGPKFEAEGRSKQENKNVTAAVETEDLGQTTSPLKESRADFSRDGGHLALLSPETKMPVANTVDTSRLPVTKQVTHAITRDAVLLGKNQETQLTLELLPDELGRLVIDLKQTKDGLQAEIAVRDPATLELLAARATEIESSLKLANLEIARLDVRSLLLASHDMNDNFPNQDQPNRRELERPHRPTLLPKGKSALLATQVIRA